MLRPFSIRVLSRRAEFFDSQKFHSNYFPFVSASDKWLTFWDLTGGHVLFRHFCNKFRAEKKKVNIFLTFFSRLVAVKSPRRYYVIQFIDQSDWNIQAEKFRPPRKCANGKRPLQTEWRLTFNNNIKQTEQKSMFYW